MNDRERQLQKVLSGIVEQTAFEAEDSLVGMDGTEIDDADLENDPRLFFVQGELNVDGNVQTFEEASVMTDNAGFVLTLPTGEEFQVTIVQSKVADDATCEGSVGR